MQNIFPNKTLPNPLPVFIYKEEMQRKVIGISKESEFRFGYKEIIQKLVEDNSDDIGNYYLLSGKIQKMVLFLKILIL